MTIDAGTGGAVVLTWSPVPGATDYVVYGRTPASENMHWTTAAPTFTDTGAPGTSETLSTGTRWSVKNLFELKNARDVVVEGNTMENVWVAGQSGYAIQLTPRNQNGHAPWSTVERVTIHDNLLRHMAGGVNILGHDSPNPSQQANHITVSHNLFDDLTQATWGTGSRPFQVGDGPDSIRIDHNTIITTDATILYFHGGPAASPTHVTGMEYTNNMSPHNTYGINGSNFSPGLSAIHAYIPDGVVIGNVLAGGTASRYPAGNLFPSPTEWQGEFMDYAGGDYRLRPDSRYKGAGTDGTDLGSNIEIVMAHAKGAAAGDVTDSPSPCPPRLEVITTALADGTVMEPYEKRLLACGSAATTGWSLLSGALPDGISLDEAGRIAGVPTAAGTFAFTVQVSDTHVPPRTASQPLSLTIALAPVVIVTETLPSGVAGAAYSTMLLATGGSGSYVWSIVDGAMPDGLTLTGAGAISGTPTTPGTFTVTVQATDAGFSQNIATHSFSIDVAPPFTISIPPPPAGTFSRPYQLRATASGQIGVVTWSIVSGALPPGITLDASTGVMAGSPTAVSTFTALVRGQDSGYVTRTADASVTIVIKRLRCQAATPHHIPPCWPHR